MSADVRARLTNLRQESWKGEGILPEQDAPTVSNHLRHAAPEHSKQKGPAAPSDSLKDVKDQGNTEKGNKDCVCSDRWTVGVDASRYITSGESAGLMGAIRDG